MLLGPSPPPLPEFVEIGLAIEMIRVQLLGEQPKVLGKIHRVGLLESSPPEFADIPGACPLIPNLSSSGNSLGVALPKWVQNACSASLSGGCRCRESPGSSGEDRMLAFGFRLLTGPISQEPGLFTAVKTIGMQILPQSLAALGSCNQISGAEAAATALPVRELRAARAAHFRRSLKALSPLAPGRILRMS